MNLFNNMEYISYCKIVKLIENKFIIKKKNEGCLDDFVIKLSNICDYKYLMIQLKTTQKEMHNMYSFHLQNKYTDLIMICYCIDENKFWIMKYDEIKHLKIKY